MPCISCEGDCETFPHVLPEQESIMVWFDKLIERWKGEEHMITLAVFILWRIWKCLIERMHNGQLHESQIAISRAVQDAAEYF